jgi:hypothetical protein
MAGASTGIKALQVPRDDAKAGFEHPPTFAYLLRPLRLADR